MTGTIVSLPPVAPGSPASLTGPYSLTIGTVLTLAPGLNATATITGTYGSQVLDLGIPASSPSTYILPPSAPATIGGVFSASAPANKFQTGIDATGAPLFAQPAFSNLSGSATAAQLPAFAGGDVTSSAGSAVLTLGASKVFDANVSASAAIQSSKLSFTRPGGGGVARTISAKLTEIASVKDFGAVGDGVILMANCSIASGAGALTVAGAAFTVGDVGKSISISGAGPAGATLTTTISGLVSSTVVNLAANASTTLSVSYQTVVYGTDDTTAIQAAFTACSGTGITLRAPTGVYIVNGNLASSSFFALEGDGMEMSKLVFSGNYGWTHNGGAIGWANSPQFYCRDILIATSAVYAVNNGLLQVLFTGGAGTSGWTVEIDNVAVRGAGVANMFSTGIFLFNCNNAYLSRVFVCGDQTAQLKNVKSSYGILIETDAYSTTFILHQCALFFVQYGVTLISPPSTVGPQGLTVDTCLFISVDYGVSATGQVLATTGASGTGSTATLTYSGAALPIGSAITVAGMTPTAYNGTWTVTGSATNSVSFASTATGPQTVAGVIGTTQPYVLTKDCNIAAGQICIQAQNFWAVSSKGNYLYIRERGDNTAWFGIVMGFQTINYDAACDIIANNFYPISFTNFPTKTAISISSTAGSNTATLIDGNTFSSMANGIQLGAGVNGVKITDTNRFGAGVSTPITDTSGNTTNIYARSNAPNSIFTNGGDEIKHGTLSGTLGATLRMNVAFPVAFRNNHYRTVVTNSSAGTSSAWAICADSHSTSGFSIYVPGGTNGAAIQIDYISIGN